MQNMKTEIYGTFGPSCKSREVLEEMIKAGMTGIRLNLSHTTLEKSRDYIDNYKTAAESQGVVPRILIDMQGPELRVGDVTERLLEEGSIVLLKKIENCLYGEKKEKEVLHQYEKSESDFLKKEKRNELEFLKSEKKKARIEIPVPAAVLSAVKAGNDVLLDDGKIKIRIDKVTFCGASARVLVGGVLKPHKSIKIVDVNVSMPVLTDHDIQNIRLAKEYGVTALMQPFVFSGEDLKQVREILKEEKAEHLQIFAKIENRIGVEHLEQILPESDLLVIARGDLGNDMPLWELPAVQKKIETICKKYQKPYMIVTQMLTSMEQNPIPTRAEVSDIFHAVYHGTKAVMVTGETAVGKYPVEVIRYLANTAKEAEKYQNDGKVL